MKNEEDQALSIAQNFLEATQQVKDMLHKETITGYQITVTMEHKDKEPFHVCFYDSLNFVMLIGAIQLANAELNSVLIKTVRDGIPTPKEPSTALKKLN